jgi:hypothetical protein
MEQGEIDRICPMLPVLEKHVCSICLGACRRVLRELPCRHAFCPHCIDPWLRQQPTCPDCRQRVGRPIMRKPVRPMVWRPVRLPGRRHVFPLLVLATLTVGGLVAMVIIRLLPLPHDAVTGRFYVGAVHMSCQPTTPQSTWTCSPLPVLCNAAAAGAASRCTVLDAADCQALMSVNSDGTAPCTWCGPVPSAPPAFVTNPRQLCSPQPHGWYAMGDCPSIANVECGWRSTKPPATPPASLPLPSAGTSGTNIHGSYSFQCRYGDTFVDYGAHQWPATARQGVGRNATQPPQGESCAALLMGHGSSTTMRITFPAECNNGDLQSNDEVITQKFGACQDKTTEKDCVDNGWCTWFKKRPTIPNPKDNIHVCLPVDLINGRATCSFPDMCSNYANAMYEMHAISLQGYTTASSPPTPTGHAAVSKDTCRCTDGYQTAKPVDGTLLICTPCPTKTYGLNGKCIDCPAGTANDSPGRAATITTSAFGHSHLITCPQCKAGTYTDLAQQSTCAPCKAGYQCSKAAVVAPVSCPAGQYSAAGASRCTQCPPGTYANLPGTKTCTPCSKNEYQPEPGKTSCSPVPAGHVATLASSLPPQTASASLSSWSSWSWLPAAAAAAHAAAAAAAAAAAPQAVFRGATATAVCPARMYVMGWTCAPCPVGHACTGGTAAPCPIDSSQALPSSASCTPCANLFTTGLKTGQSACSWDGTRK